jgi:hypothetical protein
MHLTDATFCGKICKGVTSEALRAQLLRDAAALVGLDGPATLLTLGTRGLRLTGPVAKDAKVLACTESCPGSRFLLLLVCHEFVNTAIFVERWVRPHNHQPNMYVVHLGLNDALFENGGSVLSGEIVYGSDGIWRFLVEDLFACCGSSMKHVDLPRRISVLHEVLGSARMRPATPADACVLQIKRFFLPDADGEMLDFASQLPYACRAVQYRPLNMLQRHAFLPVAVATPTDVPTNVRLPPRRDLKQRSNSHKQRRVFDSKLVKVQDEESPIERLFFVQRSAHPDVYSLFDSQRASEPCSLAGVQTLEQSRRMREVFSDKPMTHRVKMTCRYDSAHNKWLPV